MGAFLLLGPICALSSSFTWAIGTTGYSRLTRQYSAFAVNFARALIALPLFLIFTVLTSGGWSGAFQQFSVVNFSHIGWFTVSMISSYGIGDAMFLWSTRWLGIPVALAIASSYPLWTALAGVVFRGEHLTALQTVGMIMTIVGMVAVILFGKDEEASQQQVHGSKSLRTGLILAFGASLLWGLNSFSVARGIEGLTVPVGNVIRMSLGLVLSAALGLIFVPKSSILLPSREFRSWYWLFVLEGFGGSFFFAYGLGHSSLAVGATLSALAPVISVPIAWAMGLEKFSWIRTLGVVLVVIGICLLVGADAIV